MSEVILITGGGRGIGAATARLAAESGLDVAVNFRSDRVAAQATVDACVERGAQSAAFQADVAEERDVVRLFDAVESGLGGVSILVNNAGVLEQQMRFDEMSIERWRRVIDINVIGTFLCSREAIRRMSPRHGGSGGVIVNVSSAASYLGSPDEYVDYAATKGAVDSLTIGLAKEVADEGIRVNAVRPGVIHTDIHAVGGEPGRVERVAPSVPMRRGGDPDEVARTILWLASADASYVTGALVNCTGGR